MAGLSRRSFRKLRSDFFEEIGPGAGVALAAYSTCVASHASSAGRTVSAPSLRA